VIGALLSRTSMYVLKSLSETELGELFDRAVRKVLSGLAFDASARERVIGLADGDARRLLNLLELIQTAATQAGREDRRRLGADALSAQPAPFDRAVTLSTTRFRSAQVRSRLEPRCVLYWLVRMLDGGRIRFTSGRDGENGGRGRRLADPRALRVALDACETYERLAAGRELALAERDLSCLRREIKCGVRRRTIAAPPLGRRVEAGSGSSAHAPPRSS